MRRQIELSYVTLSFRQHNVLGPDVMACAPLDDGRGRR